MPFQVKNTFIDLDEELEVSSEIGLERHATAPARMGALKAQSLPSSPRPRSSKKVGSSDTSSVIDSESKETGYDTPDEVLDDQQSEIGWSRSDMHSTLGELPRMQSTLGELPPVGIWANAVEDAHDGVVADPCAWQQGWLVPGMMQFPLQFHAPAEEASGHQLYAPRDEEDKPADCGDTVTTMMRNLPKKLTQHGLLEEINSKGFAGTYDFVYLPMDIESKVNRGYAFINFMDPAYAAAFKSCYEGRQLGQFNTRKVIAILPAALQGFEANYAHYSTARVSRGDPALRPLFLRESDIKSTLLKSGPGRRRGGRRSAGSLIDVAARQQQTPVHQHQYLQACPVAAASAKAPTAPGSAVYFGLNTGPGAGGKKLGGPGAAEPGGLSGKPSNQQLVAKFCPYCGGACQPEYKFCKFCGASMALASGRD